MNHQLVEIQPRELKFTFEVKKQSSCAVQLANVTDHYVAFKVKTTSPRKYCVRPNVGIIKPNSRYDFTVTMQAQKSPPSETQCKDKFLIQSTVVAFGTTEDEITAGMFVKNSEKYIEEIKLRVVLISAPNSPVMQQAPKVFKRESSFDAFILNKPHSSVLLPVTQEPSIETSTRQGPDVLKQEASYEVFTPKEHDSLVLLPINGVAKQETSDQYGMPKNILQSGVENIPPSDTASVFREQLIKKDMGIQRIRNMEESTLPEVMEISVTVPANGKDAKWVKEMEDAKLKLVKDIEELNTKISAMDVKLLEAECTIVKLKEEKNIALHDMEMLKQEMEAMSMREGGGRKVHVGFPPLFVCMVAMISLVLGFLFRS